MLEKQLKSIDYIFEILSPLRKPYFRLFHQNMYIEYQLIAKQEIFKKYFSEWTQFSNAKYRLSYATNSINQQ